MTGRPTARRRVERARCKYERARLGVELARERARRAWRAFHRLELRSR